MAHSCIATSVQVRSITGGFFSLLSFLLLSTFFNFFLFFFSPNILEIPFVSTSSILYCLGFISTDIVMACLSLVLPN